MCKYDIGIVIATLNSAKTLEWTLLALKSQQNCSLNMIVIDSGSTDETLAICARHNVVVGYCPPGNMYQAINIGIRLLDTRWVSYLNSDDIVYRDSYNRLIELGNLTNADFVYGHSDYIDWDGRFMYSFKSAHPNLLRGLIFSGTLQFAQPAAIFRKNVYEDLNGFSEKYRSISDFDFFARAILGGKKFERLTFPTVTAFRLHYHQFSRKEIGIARDETLQFFEEHLTKNIFAKTVSYYLWRFANTKHYFLRVLRNGQLKTQTTD